MRSRRPIRSGNRSRACSGRERERERLSPWLGAAARSGVTELRRFASGLWRDYRAVAAAMTLPWSNVQVEGQVNRLKLIKRSMYGRASFDLLRLRVLHHG